MKNLLYLSALIMFLTGSILSQSNNSSTVPGKKTEKQKMFKDQNGDGLADGAPGKQKMKRDAFIDTNGDGICDTREQGLGFKRLNKQTGKQATQHRGGKK